MLHYIESLRKKPKTLRNLYAFWGALLLTLLVTGVWSMSLPNKMAQMFNRDLLAEQAKQPSQLLSGMKDIFTSMTASVQNVEQPTPYSATSSTSTTVFEIDMTKLSNSTAQQGATSSTQVWQRSYQLTEGKQVRIGTSSATTTE